MEETGLSYKGKKCPFIFKNPRFPEPLKFMSNDTVVWVRKSNADWLISNNPRMFEVMGKRKRKSTIPIKPVVEVPGRDDGIEGDEENPTVFVEDGVVEVKEVKEKKRGMPKGGWPSMQNKKGEKTNDNQERK